MRGLRLGAPDGSAELAQRVTAMGAYVGDMIADAARALQQRSAELAGEVIARDDVVDEMDLGMEFASLALLAGRQPSAADARMPATALRVSIDLERMGDLAVDIARTAQVVAGQAAALPEPLQDPLAEMSRLVPRMPAMATRAFADRDVLLVQQVVDDDQVVEGLWHRALEQLSGELAAWPELATGVAHRLLVARYLERIADLSVNIVERVVYMITGENQTLAPSHRTR